jgi:C4-dicarboxylate-specific signal transduction histidine kinase
MNGPPALGQVADGIHRIQQEVDQHLLDLDGIAPEHLSQLFDSFFSTKRRGMGLGLSITRTIVDAHGGRVWAESTPGTGTVFHVVLPQIAAQATVPLAQAAA